MVKRTSLFALYVATFLVMSGCFENKKLTPEDWLGRYTYREPAVEGKITSWEILVSTMKGSFYTIMNASNPQGNFSYNCEIKAEGNKLFVLYEKTLSNTGAVFNKGDTLVTLQKKNNEIVTTWNRLHPATFAATKNPCTCFSFRGKNENDNEISLP